MAQSHPRNKRECEGNEVQDALESYVREGARRMLVAVLEEEVNAFLGRHRYEQGKAFRGYRNGYHLAREVTVGLGPVEVKVPWEARPLIQSAERKEQ
ncbi:MAG: transposase [Dehalococcoidia bacterium]